MLVNHADSVTSENNISLANFTNLANHTKSNTSISTMIKNMNTSNVTKVVCDPNDPTCIPPPTLIVVKHVINNNGGSDLASFFGMQVIGNDVFPVLFPGSEQGTSVSLAPGSYAVVEGSRDRPPTSTSM